MKLFYRKLIFFNLLSLLAFQNAFSAEADAGDSKQQAELKAEKDAQEQAVDAHFTGENFYDLFSSELNRLFKSGDIDKIPEDDLIQICKDAFKLVNFYRGGVYGPITSFIFHRQLNKFFEFLLDYDEKFEKVFLLDLCRVYFSYNKNFLLDYFEILFKKTDYKVEFFNFVIKQYFLKISKVEKTNKNLFMGREGKLQVLKSLKSKLIELLKRLPIDEYWHEIKVDSKYESFWNEVIKPELLK